MHILICRSRFFDERENKSLFVTELPDPASMNSNKAAVVYGRALLDAPYSIALREMVLNCLAMNPDERPDALTLLKGVRRGLAACTAAPETQGLGDLFAGTGLDMDVDDNYS